MSIFQELEKKSSEKRRKQNEKFFKVGKGSYSENDVFVGITMPDLRKIAQDHLEVSPLTLSKLVKSKFHEFRMCGFLILLYRYKSENEKGKKHVYSYCLRNLKYINNWDIVDVIVPSIIGDLILTDKLERVRIEKLSKSKNLWRKRISVLSCFPMIKKGEYKMPFRISLNLISDKEDLVQKALGWMLREIYNQDKKELEKYLDKYYDSIARTTLRYAIEKMPEKERKKYLNLNKTN